MSSQKVVGQGGPIVYHSLKQVIQKLTAPEVIDAIPDVKKLLEIGRWNKIIDEGNNVLPLQPRYPPTSHNQPKMPFVVIEGLDGSGKTRVSTGLSDRLSLQLMRTPPNFISSFKKSFDDHCESIRRAYYSYGNYLAANEVNYYCFSQGVVMDRYWHSTAAYALAHEMTTKGPNSIPDHYFDWPSDLCKPDLVVLLIVSEETRRFRHAYRNTTNTKEEQSLANSPEFRQNLIDCYTRIRGPKLVQVDANDESRTNTVDENVEAVIRRAYDTIVDKLNIPRPVGQSTTGKLSV